MNIDDENAVAEWMCTKRENLKIEITLEPISNFIGQIQEMISSYDEYPEDKKRTKKIVKLLKNGEEQFPVYVLKNDKSNFIMEGRHRIVAFYMQGLKHVPVARCNLKNLLKNKQ